MCRVQHKQKLTGYESNCNRKGKALTNKSKLLSTHAHHNETPAFKQELHQRKLRARCGGGDGEACNNNLQKAQMLTGKETQPYPEEEACPKTKKML